MISILKTLRYSLAEEEVGGINKETLNETLYEIEGWTSNGTRSDKREISPCLWKNYIYWSFKCLYENIGDGVADPLDAGLGWTKQQLVNYFSSIDFVNLYEGQRSEGGYGDALEDVFGTDTLPAILPSELTPYRSSSYQKIH